MKITIDFDEKNITQLMKAVHFGGWIANATKSGDEVDTAVEEFEQHILGCLYNAGEKTRIAASSEGEYHLAPDLDEALYEKIQEYDSDTFWEELVDQLARRDYYQKNPSRIGKALEGKAAEETIAGIEREKEKYDKEFEERGVERLRIVR